MMSLLAQIQNVEAGFLHQLLMALIGLASLAAVLLSLWTATRKQTRDVGPQPFQVQGVPSSDERCRAMHAPILKEISNLSHGVVRSEEYAKDRREKIYLRLESLERTQAATPTKTDIENLRRDLFVELASVHTRVDNLPDKVVAILRNAGALS